MKIQIGNAVLLFLTRTKMQIEWFILSMEHLIGFDEDVSVPHLLFFKLTLLGTSGMYMRVYVLRMVLFLIVGPLFLVRPFRVLGPFYLVDSF